jgi:hypothetical protein
VQQHHTSGRALDEDADRSARVDYDDQIAFPVPGIGPVIGLL